MLYQELLKTLKEEKKCPFCFVNQHIFIEKKHVYMTISIVPYHDHHLLVIPKRHVESTLQLTKSENKEILELQIVGMNIIKKIGYEGATWLVRDGYLKNKSVPHLHFHLVPETVIGDLDNHGRERKVLSDKEINKTVADVNKILERYSFL